MRVLVIVKLSLKRLNLFIIILMCNISLPSQAQDTFQTPAMNSGLSMPKEQRLAVDYMLALTGRDYNSLSSYYSRDSQFYDKTANRKYKGRRQIVAFLKRAQQGALDYKFSIEHMFNANSLVVLIGNYHFRGPGEQFGKPGKIINIAIPGVTSLKLDTKTHRIIQHTDLIDYQTMADQLAEQ